MLIHIERVREHKERDRDRYIHMYIYIYIEKERERDYLWGMYLRHPQTACPPIEWPTT